VQATATMITMDSHPKGLHLRGIILFISALN